MGYSGRVPSKSCNRMRAMLKLAPTRCFPERSNNFQKLVDRPTTFEHRPGPVLMAHHLGVGEGNSGKALSDDVPRRRLAISPEVESRLRIEIRVAPPVQDDAGDI